MRWVRQMLAGGLLVAAAGIIGPLVHGAESQPGVQITAAPALLPGQRLALTVRWRWQGRPSPLRRWPILAWADCRCLGVDPEDLLAVSFDTRHWAYEGDDAPFGRGAYGLPLRRLETVRGPDPARRLYFVPPGRDGQVTVVFRPVGRHYPVGSPFRIDFVHDYGQEGWVLSGEVHSPPNW